MTNNNFSQQSEGDKLLKTCSPLLVYSSLDPNTETAESVYVKQEKFLSLSQKNKDKLASTQIVQKIQTIGQKYEFELLHLANITRLIREYYFGEVRIENFPSEIEKRMGVSLLTAQEITRYLKQEIIDWDPWAEYIAKLPKLPIREIVQQYPKIGNTEITSGYIELKGSKDLEDPTIKNWLKDFVSHLGYDPHSQMDRAQYLFHSENGKDLSSQDREKLGIILKSFDEKVPLPVDEENGEIVFDAFMEHGTRNMEQKNPPPTPPFSKGERPIQSFPLSQRGTKGDFENAADKQRSFIKPYAPISQPTLPPRQASSSPIQAQTQSIPQPRPIGHVPDNFASQAGKEEINKYFSAPESLEIPEIKIHSITEHNEPKIAPPQTSPQSTAQRPVLPQPQLNIQRPIPQQPTSPRPQHRIIDPFEKRMIEPRLDGNIVDLSREE